MYNYDYIQMYMYKTYHNVIDHHKLLNIQEVTVQNNPSFQAHAAATKEPATL